MSESLLMTLLCVFLKRFVRATAENCVSRIYSVFRLFLLLYVNMFFSTFKFSDIRFSFSEFNELSLNRKYNYLLYVPLGLRLF